jgi:hypothetical protein
MNIKLYSVLLLTVLICFFLSQNSESIDSNEEPILYDFGFDI